MMDLLNIEDIIYSNDNLPILTFHPDFVPFATVIIMKVHYPGHQFFLADLSRIVLSEIETNCDACEKADSHPDCSPGVCSFYLIEDYLAEYHPELFNEMKEAVMQRLRREYPDPNEQ